MRKNFMRDRSVFQTNADHLVAGHFTTFADRIGNFPGFAKPDAHAPTSVTDHDQSAKIETPTALDDFGGAINENDLFGQFLALALLGGVCTFRAGPATSGAKSAARA
jgi:hypothetical protein